MRYLPLLWAGLFRRKARTILTILSVVISFLLLGLLDAVTVAFEEVRKIVVARPPRSVVTSP